MISTALMTALVPAIGAGLQLAAAGVKKAQDAGEINVYMDRAALFNDLFDPDKREGAYLKLYAEMQGVIARKGTTPSMYYYDDMKKEGAPCLSLPIATIKELLDAATK